jgi:hypothetical protein
MVEQGDNIQYLVVVFIMLAVAEVADKLAEERVVQAGEELVETIQVLLEHQIQEVEEVE